MMNTSGATAVAVKKEISNDDKKTLSPKPPIHTLAMGFSNNVAQDKKLADLSNKLQNIDEKTIRDFAKHLNEIGQGIIISDELVNNAIKGLKYEGDKIPDIADNDKNFTKIDDEIKQATQKMMFLNSALLIVNPNLILHNPDENMAILPIPVLASHEEKLNDLFKDEKEFSEKSKALLPKAAQEIFTKNYPILQQKTIEEASQSDIKNIASANLEDTQKITKDIVDNVAQIYQMVTLRFLAQLGSPVIPDKVKKEN
jgi:hypothetical protein